MEFTTLPIYPTNGNYIIAAMIIAFAMFLKNAEENSENYINVQVDKLSLSFSSERKIYEFVKDVKTLGVYSIEKSVIINVFPAYNNIENAYKIINYAILNYTSELKSIDQLSFLFYSEQEADKFMKIIDKLINKYFNSKAFEF